jgi:hypothetical protein
MSNAREIPWPRIVVEGAAIVVSILLAFWIQAWWDNRQEREEVHDLLQSVLEDLRSGKAKIDFYRKMSVARMDSADALLMASKGGDESITDEESDRLLAELTFFSDAEVISEGSIIALLNGGNIGVIESKRLRELLSGWPTELNYARNNVKGDYDFLYATWIPYLKIHGNITQIMRGLAHIPGHPETTDWQSSVILAGEPVSHLELLQDNEFINNVATTRFIQFNNLDTYDDLEERIDESIQLIEIELQELSNSAN